MKQTVNITNSQRPTANSQRPTANTQRPTANTQRPTANTQRPTANTQRPTARWMTMAMAALALTACQQEQDDLSPAAIELTTPVIQLDGVQASTRAAQRLGDVASGAGINLYMHESEERESKSGRKGWYEGSFSGGINWTANPSVTVTGGEGHYRAGIVANIELTATADMPAIGGTIYGYRGSINVKADGTFIPDGTLQPYSAAVLLKLKDADGADIDPVKYDTPNGEYAEGAKQNDRVYLINPVGIAWMAGFAADPDSQHFPNGTADPVLNTRTYTSYQLTSSTKGDFTPGTYPATWTEGVLVTTEGTPANAWPLFEVAYCKDGFNYDEEGELVPNGATTTWTVSYPAGKQLTLDAGKLYTFTATLGADAHITLDAASAVSISDWATGETINIGR